MPIFRIEGDKLRQLSVQPLGKERDLQKLVEQNLTEALGLKFLASEYTTTSGGRIDTLAVDEAGAPVIIEYKRNRNDSVINQALSYLLWLKTQRPEFFQQLMADRLGADVAKDIVLDWRSPRVICVAESYSRFDFDTVEVVPLRIELYRYRFYEDQVFSLERAYGAPDEAAPPLQAEARPERSRDAKPESDVDRLLAKASSTTAPLFADLREWITTLDEAVVERATALYVAYRVTKNFAEVHISRDQLKVNLRPLAYDDPEGRIETVPETYKWTLDRRIYIRNEADLEAAKKHIEQSFRDVL